MRSMQLSRGHQPAPLAHPRVSGMAPHRPLTAKGPTVPSGSSWPESPIRPPQLVRVSLGPVNRWRMKLGRAVDLCGLGGMGRVNLGCVKLGCVKLGCVKLGCVKLGCVKLGRVGPSRSEVARTPPSNTSPSQTDFLSFARICRACDHEQ